MKNKNNNRTIVLDERILADIEEDLTLLMEIMQEKYENEFTIPELYEAFKRITAELKDSLEELNIVDEPSLIQRVFNIDFELSDEQIEYNKSLN